MCPWYESSSSIIRYNDLKCWKGSDVDLVQNHPPTTSKAKRPFDGTDDEAELPTKTSKGDSHVTASASALRQELDKVRQELQDVNKKLKEIRAEKRNAAEAAGKKLREVTAEKQKEAEAASKKLKETQAEKQKEAEAAGEKLKELTAEKQKMEDAGKKLQEIMAEKQKEVEEARKKLEEANEKLAHKQNGILEQGDIIRSLRAMGEMQAGSIRNLEAAQERDQTLTNTIVRMTRQSQEQVAREREGWAYAELHTSHSQLLLDFEKLREENEDLQEEKTALQNAVNANGAPGGGSTSQGVMLGTPTGEEKIAALEAKLQALQRTNTNLKQAIVFKDQAIQDHAPRVSELQKKLEEKDAAKDQVNKDSPTGSELSSRLFQANGSQREEELAAIINEQKTTINGLRDEKHRLEQSNAAMSDRFESKIRDMATLKVDHTKAIGALEGTIQLWKTEHKTLENASELRIQTLEAKLATLRPLEEQKSTLEGELKNKSSAFNEQTTRLELLEKADSANAELLAGKTVAEVVQEHHQYRNENLKLTKKLEEASKSALDDAKSLRDNITQLKNEVKEQAKTVTTQQEQLKTLSSEKSALKDELKRKNSALNEKTTHLEAFEKAQSANIAALAGRSMTEIVEERDKYYNEMSELANKLREMENDAVTASAQVKSFGERSDRLENEVKEQAQTISKQKEQLEDFEKANSTNTDLLAGKTITEIVQEHHQYRNENLKLTKKLEEASKSALDDAKSLRDNITQLKNEVKEQAKTVTTQQEQLKVLESAQTNVATLSEGKTALEEELKRKSSVLNEKTTRLEDLEKANSANAELLAGKTVAEIVQEHREYRNEKLELAKKLGEASKNALDDAKSLRENITRLENMVKEQAQTIDSQKAKIDPLERESKEYANALRGKTLATVLNDIRILERRCDTAEHEHRKKYTDLQDSYKILQDKHRTEVEARHSAENAQRDTQLHFNVVERERDEARTKTKTLQVAFQCMKLTIPLILHSQQADLAQKDKDHMADLQRKGEEINAISTQLSDSKNQHASEVDELKAQLKETKETVAQLKGKQPASPDAPTMEDVARLRSQLEELKKELAEAKSIEDPNPEIDRLRHELEAAKKELNMLKAPAVTDEFLRATFHRGRQLSKISETVLNEEIQLAEASRPNYALGDEEQAPPVSKTTASQPWLKQKGSRYAKNGTSGKDKTKDKPPSGEDADDEDDGDDGKDGDGRLNEGGESDLSKTYNLYSEMTPDNHSKDSVKTIKDEINSVWRQVARECFGSRHAMDFFLARPVPSERMALFKQDEQANAPKVHNSYLDKSGYTTTKQLRDSDWNQSLQMVLVELLRSIVKNCPDKTRFGKNADDINWEGLVRARFTTIYGDVIKGLPKTDDEKKDPRLIVDRLNKDNIQRNIKNGRAGFRTAKFHGRMDSSWRLYLYYSRRKEQKAADFWLYAYKVTEAAGVDGMSDEERDTVKVPTDSGLETEVEVNIILILPWRDSLVLELFLIMEKLPELEPLICQQSGHKRKRIRSQKVSNRKIPVNLPACILAEGALDGLRLYERNLLKVQETDLRLRSVNVDEAGSSSFVPRT
ncbi:hypothetical protein PM082_023323 [Marasmius tenuissimus]|nr:hypothetical protein PM082_023323 [Marasmius tenuissimus]